MGEGCASDAELMNYVSSVNIACGYHAGDAETMRKTVETAVKKGVAIGAHPGYRDREGFGRRAMKMSPDEIFDIVTRQVVALRNICVETGRSLKHVKPHGGLYNQSAKDAETANAIAMAVRSIDPDLILFGLSGSTSISEAKKCGLRTASEVFADRTYQPDGSLTPRTEANALIHDTHISAAQVLTMIRKHSVTTVTGEEIPIIAETICIHGDGENALKFARSIRYLLTENEIEIVPING